MRYLVVGTLTFAGIALGSFVGVGWALDGSMALAWTAFAFGILGVLVLIACLGLYALMGLEDDEERPRTGFGPAPMWQDRAHERAWLREPPAVAAVRPAGLGAARPRPNRGEAHSSKRPVAR